MATPIVMPSFGMYTAEGTLVNWLHADGTTVRKGETVLEIETEKAVNPVISPVDGVVSRIIKVGTLVKEQDILGYILTDGESAPTSGAKVREAASSDAGGASNRQLGEGQVPGNRLMASPAARKLASEKGINLATVVGSGPGGRIVEADLIRVAEHLSGQPEASTVDSATPRAGEPSPRGVQLVPLNTMRRAIGDRLRRSIDTAVSLTIAREVVADDLVKARATISAKLNRSLPYDVLFLKLLGAALIEHRELNAIIEEGKLRIFDEVSIGLAVAVPNGLVVPVVRNVANAPLLEIANQVQLLTDRARANALCSEDLVGGASTITNLGGYAVDIFTPVLNPPQSTILGIGRIAERPIVKNGIVSVGQTCWLCLTFDHRLTDGAPAASLLQSLVTRMTDVDYLCNLA